PDRRPEDRLDAADGVVADADGADRPPDGRRDRRPVRPPAGAEEIGGFTTENAEYAERGQGMEIQVRGEAGGDRAFLPFLGCPLLRVLFVLRGESPCLTRRRPPGRP